MWLKICGITSSADAELSVRAGADAIGLNLVPESPRHLTLEHALGIARAVDGRVRVVAVVADKTLDELLALRSSGIDWLQLHGEETPELVATLQPQAYKALRIGGAEDVVRARSYPGEVLLVDAKVAGMRGGSGQRFDWSLVRGLARERPLILAGGLNPENVRDAVVEVSPWGIDVASGVEIEGRPREKDPAKVQRFVAAARAAALGLGLLGCASSQVRGGEVLRPGHVPVGQQLVEFRPEGCRDARGAKAPWASSVRLIREPSGRDVLVELRQGYPSLMVKNAFSDGPERVYQVVVGPAGDKELLHEFRLPAAPGARGRVSVGHLRDATGDQTFRARAEDVIASCSLVDVQAGR